MMYKKFTYFYILNERKPYRKYRLHITTDWYSLKGLSSTELADYCFIVALRRGIHTYSGIPKLVRETIKQRHRLGQR